MLTNYKATTTTGEVMSGIGDADTAASARGHDRPRQATSSSMPRRGAARQAGKKRRLGVKQRVPKTELLMLTNQLAIMCDTGVDLAEAIEESARQATHPVLRRSLIEIHRDINDGKPIAKAMQSQADIFGSTYVASFAAGESSGKMTEVLNRLTDILDGEIRLRSMLKSVMAYPIVLASLSAVTILVLLFFVLPHFGQIFDDMQVPLPGTTKALLALSHSLTTSPLWWLAGTVATLVGGYFVFRTPTCRRKLDYLALHGKVISSVSQALQVGRAFRLCGSMVESGVPLLEAIHMTKSSVKNSIFRELFDKLETEVLNGRGIGGALTATRYIPRGAARMVVTAEKTGKLGQVMEKVGTFYESEGERRLQEMSKLLEPAIIIFMGCVVATVVLSILLPMFALTQMAGIR